MDKYISLVLVKHMRSDIKYLFQAPRDCGLVAGDEVEVETKHGIQTATVLDCLEWVEKDTDSYDFIIRATGANTPLKRVVSKIEHKKFEYVEGDNE